jgi:hypothetical protein
VHSIVQHEPLAHAALLHALLHLRGRRHSGTERRNVKLQDLITADIPAHGQFIPTPSASQQFSNIPVAKLSGGSTAGTVLSGSSRAG